MKRTLIEPDLSLFPKKLHPLVISSDIYDSSCSERARVWLIDGERQYYLKRAGAGELERECEMTECFYKHSLSVRVCEYFSDGEYDWLLTRAASGDDCVHQKYLGEPERLCDKLAEALRRLHETDFSFCPAQSRTEEYLLLAEKNYRDGIFDPSHSSRFKTAEDAWEVARHGKELLCSDSLIHGDFCLPNIIIDDWKRVTYIDVDHSGVGDRHIDLYWCAWSLRYNLGTDRYRDRLFDAYGRDAIDTDVLDIIEAIETFG